jgi:hypothetical protein
MAISGGWIFGNGLKLVHRLLPHLVEMGAQTGDAFGGKAIVAAGSGLAVENQPGVFKHAQVLRDGWPADGEGAGEFVDGQRTGGELLEDGHAGGVPDGIKSGL